MILLLVKYLYLEEVPMVIEIGRRNPFKVKVPKVRRIPKQANTRHYNRMLKRMRKDLPYLSG